MQCAITKRRLAFDVSTLPLYAFSPLGTHDRAAFSSGIPELDDYFQRQAGQDAKRNVAAPFVRVDAANRIVGYYTLSSYGIRSMELPPGITKKLPRYPLIPATLLGRLAVSREHQGRKLGRLLLIDALNRSLRNTSEVASVGVVAEAINDAAHAFYLHHEFVTLAEDSRKLFISMGTIQKAFR